MPLSLGDSGNLVASGGHHRHRERGKYYPIPFYLGLINLVVAQAYWAAIFSIAMMPVITLEGFYAHCIHG